MMYLQIIFMFIPDGLGCVEWAMCRMIQSALEKPLDFMVISTQGIQGTPAAGLHWGLRTVSGASYQIQVEFAGMHPAASPFIVFILTTHSLL